MCWKQEAGLIGTEPVAKVFEVADSSLIENFNITTIAIRRDRLDRVLITKRGIAYESLAVVRIHGCPTVLFFYWEARLSLS